MHLRTGLSIARADMINLADLEGTPLRPGRQRVGGLDVEARPAVRRDGRRRHRAHEVLGIPLLVRFTWMNR